MSDRPLTSLWDKPLPVCRTDQSMPQTAQILYTAAIVQSDELSMPDQKSLDSKMRGFRIFPNGKSSVVSNLEIA